MHNGTARNRREELRKHRRNRSHKVFKRFSLWLENQQDTETSIADELLERMFSWIEQRERCARKLKQLAQELESLRQKCNASECVGSSLGVAGAACLIGAGVATLFTGGAAAPLLGLAGVYTGIGAGISVVTKAAEHLVSSITMIEAQNIERKNNRTTKEIQKLFQRLKAEQQQASPSAGPDDLDQHIMTEMLRAMARRSGSQHQFIVRMLKHSHSFFDAGPGTMGIQLIILCSVMMAGILSFFTLKACGEKHKLLFAKGGQQLVKKVSTTGLKTALKGGAMVVGGAVGMAFALPEAIDNWTELAKKNQVTEASQSLRDTADDLLEISRTLKKQLDKIEQMFQEFEELKCCIENSDRTSEQKKNFIKIVKRYCNNEAVLEWLKETYDTEVFFKLVDMFYFLKQELDKEKKKLDRENIDIIFVAHGCIEEPLIPASDLLPLSTIEDVILYSPWNCAIDACAAYGIATGNIQPENRIFCCQGGGCQVSNHRPNVLPNHWNSMKNAAGWMIPNISVSPLRKPEDLAWNGFVFLRDQYGRPGRNRVVIPYMLPEFFRFSGKVPFYVVTLALSLVLFIFPFKATVHLAACLGRASGTTLSEQSVYLNQQYTCTIDHTIMTVPEEVFRAHPGLYRALRSVFDQ
uniref:uncharacterized protein n=1 Tax=Semicossyphus pulcher TaxID=241346 RepID=UPI0037E6FEAF